METLNICLVGFGSVNRALVRLVAREAEWLQKHHSLDVQVSAIVARHGAWEPRSGDYLPPVAVLARLADMVAAGEARLDAGSLAAAAATLGIDAATVLATTAPPTAAVLELIARRLAPPADGQRLSRAWLRLWTWTTPQASRRRAISAPRSQWGRTQCLPTRWRALSHPPLQALLTLFGAPVSSPRVRWCTRARRCSPLRGSRQTDISSWGLAWPAGLSSPWTAC